MEKMARKAAGAGGMPEGIAVREVTPEQAKESAAGEGEANFAHEAGANAEGAAAETHPEGTGEAAGRQPDFRVVQPEYNSIEGKTIFKDVGALWKNISRKTGREFYTMKIGKLKLLVFPNTKLEQ